MTVPPHNKKRHHRCIRLFSKPRLTIILCPVPFLSGIQTRSSIPKRLESSRKIIMTTAKGNHIGVHSLHLSNLSKRSNSETWNSPLSYSRRMMSIALRYNSIVAFVSWIARKSHIRIGTSTYTTGY
jgi:hypothetical protein